MWIGQVLPGRFDVRKRLSGRKLLHDTVYKDGVFGGVLVSGRFDVSNGMFSKIRGLYVGKSGNRLFNYDLC